MQNLKIGEQREAFLKEIIFFYDFSKKRRQWGLNNVKNFNIHGTETRPLIFCSFSNHQICLPLRIAVMGCYLKAEAVAKLFM